MLPSLGVQPSPPQHSDRHASPLTGTVKSARRMVTKKKRKAKAKAESTEPPHDPYWMRAMEAKRCAPPRPSMQTLDLLLMDLYKE